MTPRERLLPILAQLVRELGRLRWPRGDYPSILAEVYRIYGERHLPKSIAVELESVSGLVKASGSDAAANPANFVDASLVQDLEREGSFQTRTR